MPTTCILISIIHQSMRLVFVVVANEQMMIASGRSSSTFYRRSTFVCLLSLAANIASCCAVTSYFHWSSMISSTRLKHGSCIMLSNYKVVANFTALFRSCWNTELFRKRNCFRKPACTDHFVDPTLFHIFPSTFILDIIIGFSENMNRRDFWMIVLRVHVSISNIQLCQVVICERFRLRIAFWTYSKI